MTSSVPLSRVGTPSSHTRIASARSSPHHDPPESPGLPHVISFENVEEVARDIRPRWKRDLYMLLERPTSSPGAFLIHIGTTSLIVISAMVTVLETIPSSHSISGSVWFGLETSLVALFTVEYIARAVAHSYSWSALARWGACECYDCACAKLYGLIRCHKPSLGSSTSSVSFPITSKLAWDRILYESTYSQR